MPFQSSVNAQQAPAIAGDFASANPRASATAGPGGLISGAAGVTVGLFAWIDQSDYKTVNNFGSGAPNLFVHREQQALITTYLSETSNLIPAGFMVTGFVEGEFWVKNDGTTQAVPGQKAFAYNNSGKAAAAATGSTITGASVTGSIAASTFSVTGSIADNIMTVSATSSGTIVAGATCSGTGVASGTQVVKQLTPLLSGEALGGVGRYEVTPTEQAVASTTISGTYGTMTVTATGSGALAVGDLLSGSGVAAGTTLTQFLTGSGGNGTYVVNNNTVVTSTTITALAATETGWFVRSPAAPGELMKISSRAIG